MFVDDRLNAQTVWFFKALRTLSLPPDLTGVGSQLLLTVVPRLANVSTEFINVAFNEATESDGL